MEKIVKELNHYLEYLRRCQEQQISMLEEAINQIKQLIEENNNGSK